MNKTFLTLILSALVLSACGPTASTTVNNSPSSTPTKTETSVAKSLKDLMALGTAQKCTWQVTDTGQEITGTMLISGQKFKQTIVIPVPSGQTTTTYAISDGTNLYSWSDVSKGVGMKINLADAQKNAPTPGQKTDTSVDWSKQYNYNCSPAVVSDADFALPSDVKFTDLSEIQNSLQKLDLDKLKQQFGQ
ncbi:MAG: hypothetical protein NTY75_03245 [Candidatus Shapirobacteria bacterium]|nr:hypothetical protein [Candidatus Shapirobacteria bacterium]